VPEDQEPVVVAVNQALARQVWGHDDVIGEVLFGTLLGQEGSEVVGVLEDLAYGHPAATPEPVVFRGYPSMLSTVIESSLGIAELQRALENIDPTMLDIRISRVESLESLRAEMLAPDRARTILTLATSILVIALTAVGFYGTQQYLVASGRREYAIRASHGAGPRSLGWLVMRRGLRLALPGMVFGALLGFIAVAWLRADYLTHAISPFLAVIWVVAGLAAIVLAANAGPAWQAMRTRPAELMREG
jgi:ABC-type antimicrobial peptide transport system permease subunit